VNLYKLVLEDESKQHRVVESSKMSNDNNVGIDYINSRGIFYYDYNNVIIDMDFDFNNPNDPNPKQAIINKDIYNNAKVFIRNSKLEDLDI
jgi:hypothetical protein